MQTIRERPETIRTFRPAFSDGDKMDKDNLPNHVDVDFLPMSARDTKVIATFMAPIPRVADWLWSLSVNRHLKLNSK